MRLLNRESIRMGLIHVYVVSSILATLLLWKTVDLSMMFYTVGASSGYIAFGVATAESINLNAFLGIAAMLWAALFPIGIVVTYILAIKKMDKPICYLAVADAIIVVAWVIFAKITGNDYGVQTFIFDAVVSVIFAAVLLCLCKKSPSAKSGETPAL